ncbi:hypothetical protein OH77DRAFT_992145 [Trametes cingulata]|nr:hypothetical protein OH77DRAFT_992145 [Trametes cingulata]
MSVIRVVTMQPFSMAFWKAFWAGIRLHDHGALCGTSPSLQSCRTACPSRLNAKCESVHGCGGTDYALLSRDLQDNFTTEWDPHTISEVLRPYVLEYDISVILTFDRRGISSHPNHISLPKGAAHLLSTLPTAEGRSRPRLFALVTVPLHEKYLGPVSPILSKLAIAFTQRWQSPPSSADTPAAAPALTLTATAVSDWAGYTRALKAMMQHRSQLVWFRWLYVSFSRYMWVNEWVEVVPPSEVQTASGAVA